MNTPKAPVVFKGIQPAPEPLPPLVLLNCVARVVCLRCRGLCHVRTMACWPCGGHVEQCDACEGNGAVPKGGTTTPAKLARMGYDIPNSAAAAAQQALAALEAGCA